MTETSQDKSTLVERIILWFLGTVCFLIAAKVLFFAAIDWPRWYYSPRAECLSNLRHLSIAIGMYAEKYQGRCPMDSTNPTLVGSMQLLSNFVKSAAVLYCQSDRRAGARPEADFRKLTTKNISYSYVPNLVWQSSTPDSIVVLDRIYVTAAGSTWPSTGNHKDAGDNILCDDGHVDFRTRLPSVLKDKDGKEIVLSP